LISVRHSLGAVLMKQQRSAEAEQVYRDDLPRLPENGWSLPGLAESCGRKGKTQTQLRKRTQSLKKFGQKPSPHYHFVPLPAAGVTSYGRKTTQWN
jgi:predicted Zn-dependent protease